MAREPPTGPQPGSSVALTIENLERQVRSESAEAGPAPAAANGGANGVAHVAAGPLRAEDGDAGSDGSVSMDPAAMKRSGTFAPVGGMNITVKGLTFTVPCNSGRRGRTATLLSDVTGYFEPRRMAALMGPSGSGKTTLLDLLAGRKTTGKAKGDILFAGNRPTRPFLRRYTGYVEQFDTLLPILTVEEMLMYTAELKRPRRESRATKRAAVEELLEKLALTSCRAVKIGNPLEKGISGGQSKRTNIGIALITNPRVLMLDEPTSGLDSFTANEVVTLVKALTGDGVTVLATIHSPTAYTFSLFDSMMILLRGRVVYFGPNDSDAIDYVRGLGGGGTGPQYKAGLNDAEWLADFFTQADRDGRAAAYAEAWAASPHCAETSARVDALAMEGHLVPPSMGAELAVRHATNTPWWWGLATLVKYRTSRNFRDPAFLGARLGDKLFTGLLLMTLWFGIGNKFTLDNYINVAAVLFIWTTIPAFGAAAFVPSLVLERRLFVRERHDGLYRVITYLLGKMTDEVGIALFGSVVMSVVVYFGVKLQGSLVVFWMVYFSTICAGIGMAYAVASLSPNMDVANASLPTYVATLMFFSGFLIRYEDIPIWWKWYSYINPLRYSWTALMLNQFEGRDPKFLRNRSLLTYYGIEGQSKWANVGYVWVFAVGYFFICWLVLCVKRYDKR
ncbi:P-loop containing nucleoside triphosphate hydrolase [Raphidocelis subcapitata]|uniref:P-loop containing nucleoside triphosphate hydrolase n=1 Tax=Raphidocelis subcapitata TaxID=307507 RepID=A0A2V0P645_9CHLO|nr:P-loop containing nucleoside triphosphate hydrolase [Raphidocelis subcapitata]|eukprot:GBF95049.1 P-loop containing nucleoside triphosphate hydrolase [Raphidocelis subcapitata]